MSYQVNDECFASPESALSVLASRMYGAGIDSAGNPVSYYTVVDGSSLKTITSTGAYTLVTPSLQSCQLLDWPQASAISLTVGMIWACAFGYAILRRQLHSAGDDTQ